MAVSSSSTSIFNPVSNSSANWLASTWSDIQTSESSTSGILGALQSSASSSADSLSSFINDTSISDALSTISQTSTTNTSAFYAQLASQNQQAAQKATLQKALDDLQSSKDAVQPTNVLDPDIYFQDGSYLDTNSNILTMSDGTQYDTTTGLKYVDPSSLIQFGNGSYLDTKNNVLTMTDGTQIDTVTGLKLTTTA